MKNLKTLVLASAAALALLAAPASAQFQPTPSNPTTRITYRAAIIGLVPAATPTDILTISGSATKSTVVVDRIECSGFATTAGAMDIVAVKRSAINTGGTSTAPVKVPLDANNTLASGAVVAAYTVNPSTLGTAVGPIRADKFFLPVAAGTLDSKVTWDFGSVPYSRHVVLRGVGQVLAINLNGGALPAGTTVDCSVEWFEN